MENMAANRPWCGHVWADVSTLGILSLLLILHRPGQHHRIAGLSLGNFGTRPRRGHRCGTTTEHNGNAQADRESSFPPLGAPPTALPPIPTLPASFGTDTPPEPRPQSVLDHVRQIVNEQQLALVAEMNELRESIKDLTPSDDIHQLRAEIFALATTIGERDARLRHAISMVAEELHGAAIACQQGIAAGHAEIRLVSLHEMSPVQPVDTPTRIPALTEGADPLGETDAFARRRLGHSKSVARSVSAPPVQTDRWSLSRHVVKARPDRYPEQLD